MARHPQSRQSRVTAVRVRLNRDGRDSRGVYHGVGEPLYRVTDETGRTVTVRAPDAASARAAACTSRWRWSP